MNNEIIKNNIKNYSSQKLADIIILYRYFGMLQEIANLAMEELSFRRQQNDNFNFEDYISNNLKSLPNLNFNNKEAISILKNIRGINGKRK